VIAQALAEGGFEVALIGRTRETLEETASLLPAGASAVIRADVSSEESVAEAFQQIRERWGRLDLLVNNAGTFGTGGAVDELEPAVWEQVLGTNITGPFLCARQAVTLMKEQRPAGGRIINNGSISAHTPRPKSVAYTASKHAITGLTKSIALDGRAHSIACGQIDIGNAATQMTGSDVFESMQPDGSLLAEPTFDPRLAADAVLYMASLPLDTNVLFLTIAATGMPFVGRG
jgi:NAD(P)-dependent dehydrogenase (short-subunit alcohol dehydrogenase family)